MKRGGPVAVVLILGILLVAALMGADRRQPSPLKRGPVIRPQRIGRALASSSEYLLGRQSSDGAWRSKHYSNFRDGTALTPLVCLALLESAANRPDVDKAVEKAIVYLDGLMRDDGTPRAKLSYPTYTAALAVSVLTRVPGHEHQRDAWIRYLRDRQLDESLGWDRQDSSYGGWGYAKEPPRKPPEGIAVPTLDQPNLSATIFVLDALREAGLPSEDPLWAKTRRFVEHCQNHAQDSEDTVDNGGFFFMPGDVVRNKAGQRPSGAGEERRFVSYGSATADGLRALLRCGASTDDPRVLAARTWLEKHFSAEHHPGEYVERREHLRPALFFYYGDSVSKTMSELAKRELVDPDIGREWSRSLAAELLRRQRPDGSWANVAVDVREDDPLVATSLAVMALTRCREILGTTDERP
ncbi:hypothetical protein Pan216_23590 [Planctomycetes bacterium Pan216]|uniref:Squalene cyclase C-terminal domain-containing protein n=1 Tax=Kolteria novifilia TaxID=2527975 RepID=A0A518B3D5_9BACT|nr:hypothetical protein Pan216_23590 [Planctomycetes bacterium Pan216]